VGTGTEIASASKIGAYAIAKVIIYHRLRAMSSSSLRLPRQYFQQRVSAQNTTKLSTKQSFLCYHCSRVLPRNRFAKGQLSGKCLPGHAQPYKRFCIACGIKNGKFKPGNQATVQGCPFRFCGECLGLSLGRFCTRCNTCSFCLGFWEFSRPRKATCPDCRVRTLRIHTDTHTSGFLQDLEELICQARALINILASCSCIKCSELIEWMWTMQPKPMDLVQRGIQFEIYHFYRLDDPWLPGMLTCWPNAIVRIDDDGIVRVGFANALLNVLSELEQSSVCYLELCGSAAELIRHVNVSGRKSRVILTDDLIWQLS
jgi:hypothetical protein